MATTQTNPAADPVAHADHPGGSVTSTDHAAIKAWAEARGGKPTSVAGTGGGDDAGVLRIEFPGVTNADDSNLAEITWDEFFQKFDAGRLALVYQEQTAAGETSNFNRLVKREAAAPDTGGTTAARRTTAKKTAAERTTAKKTTAKKATPAKGSATAKKTTAARTSAAKKVTTAKKTVAKKSATKTVAQKGTTMAKTTAKKATTATAKKAPAAKKTAAKKAPPAAKKTAAKKAAPAAKKTAAKKSTAKKVPAARGFRGR